MELNADGQRYFKGFLVIEKRNCHDKHRSPSWIESHMPSSRQLAFVDADIDTGSL